MLVIFPFSDNALTLVIFEDISLGRPNVNSHGRSCLRKNIFSIAITGLSISKATAKLMSKDIDNVEM